MESLKRLVVMSEHNNEDADTDLGKGSKDEFQELSEMLNLQELDTVRRWVRDDLPKVLHPMFEKSLTLIFLGRSYA